MSKQKGQGLVEFALILPLLLMMFFGIVEFGRIFQAYVTVQHAAREAARYAVTGRGGATPDARVRAIKETAVGATAGLNVDYSRIDWREGSPLDAHHWSHENEPNALLVQVWGPDGENDPGEPGERVAVRVIYNLQPLTPTFSYFLPRIAIHGQMEMINEGFGPTVASLRGVLPPSLEPLPVMGPTDSTTLFTNASGVEVDLYSLGGDLIYVTVTDEDENFDLDATDTVTVTVTAPGDSETLTLTETDANTGVFRNTAGLPSTDGGSGDGILNTADEETITATYTDDDDSGDISSDTAEMVEGVAPTKGTPRFTDSGGGDVTGYVIEEEEIYVTVTDQDENLSEFIVEAVDVTVTDESGDSEKLTLMETGPDTGEFRNTAGLPTSADPAVPFNDVLETEGDNTIIAEYTDNDDPGDYDLDLAVIKPRVCPVEIVEPVFEHHTKVTVRSSPGDTIHLWDLSAGGTTLGSGTVQGSGCTASVDIIVSGSLVDGNMIAAISTLHPLFDTACVGGGTCSPTPTPGPTPTPTPSSGYIVLDPTCIPPDQAATITVHGFNWAHNRDINISWDTTLKATVPKAATWTQDIDIKASEAPTGTHTVTAENTDPQQPVYSQTVEIPCPPPTPTPTPVIVRPDLVITDFTVSPGANKIVAYQPVTFTAVVKNQGQADALSVFWVDLFIDPSPAPPQAGQSNGDVAWEASSFVGVGETTTVTLDYTFSVTGTHVAYGYVDTRSHIEETDETNNASEPLPLQIKVGTPPAPTLTSDPLCSNIDVSSTITVSGRNWPTDEGPINLYWDGTDKGSVSPPEVDWSQPIAISAPEAITGTHVISASTGIISVTSTYYIPCSAMGSIDGYTWILIGGDILPQGRVDVFCYDGPNLIAETTSDDNGYYNLGYIPAGTYTVKGQAYIDEVLYSNTEAGVPVSQGSPTSVNLVLIREY